jgi:tachykinin-like receptor
MFIVVLIVFGVCWLPYHAYFLYTYYHVDTRSYSGMQHIFLTFFWLAMANSAINPLIYFQMNAKYRHYLQAGPRALMRHFRAKWMAGQSVSSFDMPVYHQPEELVVAQREVRAEAVSFGGPSPAAAGGGAVSCPERDCKCAFCLVSMVSFSQPHHTPLQVFNDELIFFRRFSDPDPRREDPRQEAPLNYYKIQILQVRFFWGAGKPRRTASRLSAPSRPPPSDRWSATSSPLRPPPACVVTSFPPLEQQRTF